MGDIQHGEQGALETSSGVSPGHAATAHGPPGCESHGAPERFGGGACGAMARACPWEGEAHCSCVLSVSLSLSGRWALRGGLGVGVLIDYSRPSGDFSQGPALCCLVGASAGVMSQGSWA